MCKDKTPVNSEGTPCTLPPPPPPPLPPTALPIFSYQSIIYRSPLPRHGRHAIAYTSSLIHKNGGRHTHTHTHTHFPKGESDKHFTPVVDYIDQKNTKLYPLSLKTQESQLLKYSRSARTGKGGRRFVESRRDC